jgi:hydroxymethylbilane synthase
MKKIIKVGTRESDLAVAQSKWVIAAIQSKFPDLEFELVPMKTTGDRMLDQRLAQIGGKGLFIKELEAALINKSIDMAVHSMKDMPVNLPQELFIAAVSKREDPRDALVTADGRTLEQLAENAIIGTSSLRREVQLLQMRPGLQMKNLRGNVLTRLHKLLNNEFDGILLAMAGLKRLGLEDKCVQCFAVTDIIPAVGQGALGIETRKGEDVAYLHESVHDENAALVVSAERAYLIKLNGSCGIPIGAHAVITGGRMTIYGMLALEDKSVVYRDSVTGNKHDAVALGETLAERIWERRKTSGGLW